MFRKRILAVALIFSLLGVSVPLPIYSLVQAATPTNSLTITPEFLARHGIQYMPSRSDGEGGTIPAYYATHDNSGEGSDRKISNYDVRGLLLNDFVRSLDGLSGTQALSRVPTLNSGVYQETSEPNNEGPGQSRSAEDEYYFVLGKIKNSLGNEEGYTTFSRWREMDRGVSVDQALNDLYQHNPDGRFIYDPIHGQLWENGFVHRDLGRGGGGLTLTNFLLSIVVPMVLASFGVPAYVAPSFSVAKDVVQGNVGLGTALNLAGFVGVPDYAIKTIGVVQAVRTGDVYGTLVSLAGAVGGEAGGDTNSAQTVSDNGMVDPLSFTQEDAGANTTANNYDTTPTAFGGSAPNEINLVAKVDADSAIKLVEGSVASQADSVGAAAVDAIDPTGGDDAINPNGVRIALASEASRVADSVYFAAERRVTGSKFGLDIATRNEATARSAYNQADFTARTAADIDGNAPAFLDERRAEAYKALGDASSKLEAAKALYNKAQSDLNIATENLTVKLNDLKDTLSSDPLANEISLANIAARENSAKTATEDKVMVGRVRVATDAAIDALSKSANDRNMTLRDLPPYIIAAAVTASVSNVAPPDIAMAVGLTSAASSDVATAAIFSMLNANLDVVSARTEAVAANKAFHDAMENITAISDNSQTNTIQKSAPSDFLQTNASVARVASQKANRKFESILSKAYEAAYKNYMMNDLAPFAELAASNSDLQKAFADYSTTATAVSQYQLDIEKGNPDTENGAVFSQRSVDVANTATDAVYQFVGRVKQLGTLDKDLESSFGFGAEKEGLDKIKIPQSSAISALKDTYNIMSCAVGASECENKSGQSSSSDKPNLYVVTAPLSEIQAGGAANLSATISNNGTGSISGRFENRFQIFDNSVVVNNSQDLAPNPIYVAVENGLAAGASTVVATQWAVPASFTPGKYFVRLCANIDRNVPEANDGNNCGELQSFTIIAPKTSMKSSPEARGVLARAAEAKTGTSKDSSPRLKVNVKALTAAAADSGGGDLMAGIPAIFPAPTSNIKVLGCPPGNKLVPGTNHCIPEDYISCASVGFPNKACAPGNICRTDGQCEVSSEGRNCTSTYGQSCKSAANSCGMTNIAKYQCDGTCPAVAVPETICQPPPPILVIRHLQAKPALLRTGDTTTLYWEVSNASSCSVSGTNGDSWPKQFSSGTGGKVSRAIMEQTTYTLFCSAMPRALVQSISETQTVNVVPTFQEK